jgi:hypothetical protein
MGVSGSWLLPAPKFYLDVLRLNFSEKILDNFNKNDIIKEKLLEVLLWLKFPKLRQSANMRAVSPSS